MDPDNDVKIQKSKLCQERLKLWTQILIFAGALLSLFGYYFINKTHNKKESDSNKKENYLPEKEDIKDTFNMPKPVHPTIKLDTADLPSETKKALIDASEHISFGQSRVACDQYVIIIKGLNPKFKSRLLKDKDFVEAEKLYDWEKFEEAAAMFEKAFKKNFSF